MIQSRNGRDTKKAHTNDSPKMKRFYDPIT